MANFTPAEKLTIARIKLGKQHMFYGYLSLKLKVVEDASIGTAGVDGKGKMYFAPEFIADKTTDELMFLWAHEIGHLIFEHVSFKGNRDHMIWNMAGDYVINHIAVRDKVGTMIKGGLYDDKYANWTAAAVYDDLMKDAKANKAKYQAAEAAGGTDSHDKWGDLSEEEKEGIKKEWKNNVVSAAHAAQQAGSEVPEAFRDLVMSLTETKISWRDFIHNKIKSLVTDDVSWSRVNRRRSLGDFNYPGKQNGEEVKFLVAFDVSGSYTQDMVNEAMSEVYRATDEFAEVTIEVIQWDTRVYAYREFTQDNKLDMLEYKIEGGGGTDYNCVIKWMKDNDKVPNQMFVFTDLYFSYMPDPQICDTTFIVNGNKATAPYGETVYYDELV